MAVQHLFKTSYHLLIFVNSDESSTLTFIYRIIRGIEL